MEHAAQMEEDVVMNGDNQQMHIVDGPNKIVSINGQQYQHVQPYLVNLHGICFHHNAVWFVGDLEDGEHEIFFNPVDIPTDSSFVAL